MCGHADSRVLTRNGLREFWPDIASFKAHHNGLAVNPAIPVSALNSGALGKIQSDISGTSGLSAGDPRIIQLAVKLVF